MANRDLTTFREVTRQVVDTSTTPLDIASGALAIGKQIIDVGQQAKINENLTTAQLGVAKLNSDFKIAAESDPFNPKLQSEYKEKRSALIGSLGDDISPFYRGKYNTGAKQLSDNSDIANQAWGFQQTRVNTVNSTNKSMKTGLALAAQFGKLSGEGETNDVEVFMAFKETQKNLHETLVASVGVVEADRQVGTYVEDQVKTFISSQAQANPIKALQYLERDDVKDALTRSDAAGYQKFKTAIESRATQLDKVEVKKRRLNILRDKSNFLSKSSITEPIPYPEIMAEFERAEVGGEPYTKENKVFFLSANGWSKPTNDINVADQQKVKLLLMNAISSVSNQETVDNEDLEAIQSSISFALNKRGIKKGEADQMTVDFLAPLIDGREASLETHGQDPWFGSPKLGFDALEDYIRDDLGIEDRDPGLVADSQTVIDDTRRLQILESYYSELQNEASSRKTTIIGLDDLDDTVKEKVYNGALQRAKASFAKAAFPTLAGIKGNVTDIITKDGQKIRLFGDVSDAGEKAAADFKITDHKPELIVLPNGEDARRFTRNGIITRIQVLAKDKITTIEDIFFDSNGNAL